MAKGFSFNSFAAKLDCGVSHLYQLLDDHQEFAEAKQIGEAKSIEFWESVGIDGTCGMIGQGFNAGSWKFFMQNRLGWKNEVSVEASAKAPIKLAYDPEA